MTELVWAEKNLRQSVLDERGVRLRLRDNHTHFTIDTKN